MADLTWIDVVDSAVKIAAGAIIAGGFTYVVTKSRQSHETQKIRFEHELSILKEIVNHIEESSEILNDYSHASRDISMPSGAKEVKENSKMLMSGYKSMGKAQGLAYLIGQSGLSSVLDEMCKLLLQFYYFMSEGIEELNIEEAHKTLAEANEKLLEMNSKMKKLRNEATLAYKNILPT